MGGCGMDMTFALTYSLSRALFPNGFTCTGSLRCTAQKSPTTGHRRHRHDHLGRLLQFSVEPWVALSRRRKLTIDNATDLPKCFSFFWCLVAEVSPASVLDLLYAGPVRLAQTCAETGPGAFWRVRFRQQLVHRIQHEWVLVGWDLT